VASLSAPLGEALRVRARPADALGAPPRGGRPELLLFDRDGALLSANEEARVWLAELPHDQDLPSDLDVGVPMWMLGTVFRALAVAGGRGDGTARSRVRTRRGRWLVCHASCLHDGDGGLSDYVKAIFAKVGVSSRGELVARLFAEQYEPVHLQDVVRAHHN
jgi:hypothetical protein